MYSDNDIDSPLSHSTINSYSSYKSNSNISNISNISNNNSNNSRKVSSQNLMETGGFDGVGVGGGSGGGVGLRAGGSGKVVLIGEYAEDDNEVSGNGYSTVMFVLLTKCYYLCITNIMSTSTATSLTR